MKSTKSKPIRKRGIKTGTILKAHEFDMYVQIMSDPMSAPHCIEIARALGVAAETLSEWNKRPEVLEAKTRGVSRYLKTMEAVGTGDWKMWKEKLNMLGLTVVQKTDITSGGEKLPTPILGGLSKDED